MLLETDLSALLTNSQGYLCSHQSDPRVNVESPSLSTEQRSCEMYFICLHMPAKDKNMVKKWLHNHIC